jgi:hypothetical protein
MNPDRNREILGLGLALIGFIFLLASNNLLWIGWDAIWPILLLLFGIVSLRIFFSKRTPALLLTGIVSLFLGFFFFIFSAGFLPWSDIAVLWPTFPLIGGIALIATAGIDKRATDAVIVGIIAVLFSIACYMANSGVIGGRIAGPFIRLWPLAIVGSGVVVYLKARSERLERTRAGGKKSNDIGN